MTAPDKIVEVGAPAMWISGEDGFTMTTQASIDSDGPQHSLVRAIREATLNHGPRPSRPSFRLTRAHALDVPAVAPFKNLLPGFTTPECEADSGSTG